MSTSINTQPGITKLLETPIQDAIPADEVHAVLKSSPFIPIPKALNLRTVISPTLTPNLIFRSGTLSYLPQTSLNELKETHNITTIFDLRGSKEREKSATPEIPGVKNVWVPSTEDFGSQVAGNEESLNRDGYGRPSHRDHVGPADFKENGGKDGYVKLYAHFLETHRKAYRGVFETLRDGKGEESILLHCTAGKDRTGLIAAMILALAGASKEDITRDYTLTRIGIEPFREYLLKALLSQMGKTLEEGALDEPGMQELSGTKGDNILAVLEWMDAKWGSDANDLAVQKAYPGVVGYMITELDFPPEEIGRIRRNISAK
ncbi:tyrosine phosphatase family-domain-containing protein [Tricladium varicosporioides]|nr:tyrosine phosphatase family-domain-containing protein [Hymenoscyphus varicosporioides]